MNAKEAQELLKKSTLFFESQVLPGLKKATEKHTANMVEPNSMPGLINLVVYATSNSAKAKIRPYLESIKAKYPFYEVDVTSFNGPEKKIILKIVRDQKQQATAFMRTFKDESISQEAVTETAEGIKREGDTPPPPPVELIVNRKSFQAILVHSNIYRGKTYDSLNYPAAAKAKSNVEGGEPFTMTLYNEDDAITMLNYLKHIKCQEVAYGGKGGTNKLVVHGTLEPNIDYEKDRFNNECLTFFPAATQARDTTFEPKIALPAGSPLAAMAAWFDNASSSDQDAFLAAITVKNKRAAIKKNDIENAFISKLIKHFKASSFQIIGQQENSIVTIRKGKLTFEQIYALIAPADAFKLP